MTKTILITGASSGIGKALTEQYAQKGNVLILAARKYELLEEIQKSSALSGAEVHIFQADLSKMDEVETFARKVLAGFPKVDILINCAGISQRSQAEETSEEVDRQIMELNFFSPVKLTKLIWPLLVKSSHANIVNISSVTGTFGFPQRTAYAASKHAMEGFFESWELENKQPHIYFTIVAPGRILTNISYNALKNDGSKHQVLDEGQAKGIKAEDCARRIVKAVKHDRRKVYIVQQERILLLLHRFFPSLFVYLVKKLGLK